VQREHHAEDDQAGAPDDIEVPVGDAGDRAEQELLQRPGVSGGLRDDDDAEGERADQEDADD